MPANPFSAPAAPAALLMTLLALALLLPPTLARAAEAGAPLSGRWTVTTLGDDRPSTPVGDITFEPGDKTIGGATACNFFRGGFETSGGTDLKIHVGMMTRRGCPGPAAEHERAFLDAMAGASSYRIYGDILHVFDGPNGTGRELVQFTRTPDAALEGEGHKIVSYYWQGGLYSARPETEPGISFKDGRIDGSTGCRPFTARYTRDGDRLGITDLVPSQTRAPCADNVRDQDAAILAAVPRITAFDTNRNLVRLLEKPDGAAMLWVTPAPE